MRGNKAIYHIVSKTRTQFRVVVQENSNIGNSYSYRKRRWRHGGCYANAILYERPLGSPVVASFTSCLNRYPFRWKCSRCICRKWTKQRCRKPTPQNRYAHYSGIQKGTCNRYGRLGNNDCCAKSYRHYRPSVHTHHRSCSCAKRKLVRRSSKAARKKTSRRERVRVGLYEKSSGTHYRYHSGFRLYRYRKREQRLRSS